MLTADKNATLTDFQIQTLQIREKELNYFVGLYNSISGIAAMLAGFGFSSLRMSFPDDTHTVTQILYLCFTCGAIGLELCAILNSATCSVFGPGRFLRGRGGLQAAEVAVQVLEEKSEITLGYFMAGLYCIVISSALKAFIQYSFFNGLIVTVGLIGMTYILIISGKSFLPKTFCHLSDDIFIARSTHLQESLCE